MITPDQITFSKVSAMYGERPTSLVEYWQVGKGWIPCFKTASHALISELANDGATRFCFKVAKIPRTDYGIAELTKPSEPQA